MTRHELASLCLAVAATLAAGPARAADDGDEPSGRFCSATAQALHRACQHEAQDDHHQARALCINLARPGERRRCFADAKDELAEARELCDEQRAARGDLCGELGEQRYAPDFDPALFDADFRHLTRPNPYFPLGIGSRWRYGGGGETITVEVLDKTKLIEGVTCIVVRDLVEADGAPVEDTMDWYGQRKDGTVDYCGEIAQNFETFDGDMPPEAELVDIEGSWKTGRDGSLPGTQFPAVPTVGMVYRQEFSAGDAEDAARVVSTNYNFGRDAELDRFVPKALARFLCAANDCVVTEESSPLEPGVLGRKYYAAGIGMFVDVDLTDGEAVRLLDCNVDPRCAALPAVNGR